MDRRIASVTTGVLFVALTLGLGCGGETPYEGVRTKHNVVWICIDAQRADHLGVYGYEKETSPFIDALAGEGVLFMSAIAQESYTQASVPSYFTSTYPLEHGVFYDLPEINVLAPRFITIAEILSLEGYATAAFVFNPHLKSKYGFDQGFDLYDDNPEGWRKDVPRHESMETAQKIHEKVDRHFQQMTDRPVFLYLHYRDVHSPYAPPPPYDQTFMSPEWTRIPKRGDPDRLAYRVSQYDGEIRYTDDWLRKTFDLLAGHGLTKENTIFVLSADHGEEFEDAHPGDPGGRQHGRTLYTEQIRVPLVFSLPGAEARKRVIDKPVELVDIAPTVLDAVGIDWKRFGQFRGKSLLPVIAGGKAPERVVYTGGNHRRGALISGDWKYYRYDKALKRREYWKKTFARAPEDYQYDFGEELYNLRDDPAEKKNLIAEHADVASELRQRLDEIEAGLATAAEAPSVELDDETRKQLEALGYL